MDSFHKDILKFGSLVGLKYFQFYLRGREELLVTITLPAPSKPQPYRKSFLVTLYYRIQSPIVYNPPENTSDPTKAKQQVQVPLQSLRNWKKNQTKLRVVLEELLSICSEENDKYQYTVCFIYFFSTLSKLLFRIHSLSIKNSSKISVYNLNHSSQSFPELLILFHLKNKYRSLLHLPPVLSSPYWVSVLLQHLHMPSKFMMISNFFQIITSVTPYRSVANSSNAPL